MRFLEHTAGARNPGGDEIDWGAVEAIATSVAVMFAAVAALFAYRTLKETGRTLKDQQQMLKIEQERRQEEWHMNLASSRRTASLLKVDVRIRADGEPGLEMRLSNDADEPFENIVIDADPEIPANAEHARFSYLVSSMRPREAHEKVIYLPSGLWWRITFRDIGQRTWVSGPNHEFPHRSE